MKKIILGLCLLLFSVSLNAEGKLLFDLTAQHFSKAMATKDSKNYGKEGKYSLPNAYIVTDDKFNGYGYVSGIFTVKLKTMPKKWHVSTTIYNGDSKRTLVKISSDSGSSFILSINAIDYRKPTISINNKIFKVDRGGINEERLEVDISSLNNVIIFQINGQQFYKTKSDGFKMLKNVQVSCSKDSYIYRLEVYSK